MDQMDSFSQEFSVAKIATSKSFSFVTTFFFQISSFCHIIKFTYPFLYGIYSVVKFIL